MIGVAIFFLSALLLNMSVNVEVTTQEKPLDEASEAVVALLNSRRRGRVSGVSVSTTTADALAAHLTTTVCPPPRIDGVHASEEAAQRRRETVLRLHVAEGTFVLTADQVLPEPTLTFKLKKGRRRSGATAGSITFDDFHRGMAGITAHMATKPAPPDPLTTVCDEPRDMLFQLPPESSVNEYKLVEVLS